jgi:hypothetical protein
MSDRDDDYEIWLTDLEQNTDKNDVARTIHGANWIPGGCAQLDAIAYRAMNGNGFYSQLLRSYALEPG